MNSLKNKAIHLEGIKFCKITDWKNNEQIEFPVIVVSGNDLNLNKLHEETIIIKENEMKLDESGDLFDVILTKEIII